MQIDARRICESFGLSNRVHANPRVARPASHPSLRFVLGRPADLLRMSLCRHTVMEMKQVMIIRRIVELSNSGGGPSADEAMVRLAAVIDRLDRSSVTYEADVDALISVGSAVWTLSNAQAGANLR